MRISPIALFAVSNILEVAKASEDTYKSCAVPSFEWATFETRSAARSKGIRGAISGDTLFAAGNVRSNSDAAVNPGPVKIGMTGPFSQDDPTGLSATTVEVDIQSYPEAAGYKENAGGTFGAYEIGVAKVDRNTGVPEDMFLYGGFGYDELSGLAAKDNAIALSGHFTGNLTAVMVDGESQTIWNSNIEVGNVPNQTDQFHPNTKDNAGSTGVDDGFVIKARADDGKAEWFVRYPESNQDSQVVSVDIDAKGDIYGAGYKCSQADGAELKVCDGFVTKMASADGSILWEKMLPELGAAFFMKYDSEDESLYVSGTTSYGGAAKGKKAHSLCAHDTCAITLRMSAGDGSVEWERAAKGSPRWGIVDHTGGVEVAAAGDGPYIYVAFDDVGEDDEITSLDAGTHYAGCKNGDTITAEYDITTSKVMIDTDCPQGSTFVSRISSEAVPASQANTQAHCNFNSKSDACVIKYHKYTGLPIWGADVPAVAGLVASADGSSVHISARYSPGREDTFDDHVFLPGYARIGGLGSQTSGLFNAKLNSQTGKGEWILHSGGGNWDRVHDSVGDSEGNIYNIGFSGNIVMNWGGSLKTTINEDGVYPEGDVEPGTNAIERHIFISKLAAGTETTLSCITQCDGNTDTATISSNSCFIDGQCYMEGDTGGFFGKSCWTCDPNQDQRNWVVGPTIGSTQCYIDDLCLNTDDAFFYQRRSWSEKIFSKCRTCDPAADPYEWTDNANYVVEPNFNPPEDCVPIPDIPSLAAAAKLDTLVTALTAADLVGTLSEPGPFTVFAPTNEAFGMVNPGVLECLLEPTNKQELTDVLLYHVASGKVTSDMLSNNQKVSTVEGTEVTVTISGGAVKINEATVTTADVPAFNGVVHVIDQVLIPSDNARLSILIDRCASSDIPSLAVANKLTTLVAALTEADLVDTVSGPGPYTVFAPTNEAFGQQDPGVIGCLLEADNKQVLTDVLLYHVASGKVTSDMLSNNQKVSTVEGAEVTVTISGSVVKMNEATVVVPDVIASNGVVHVIDQVLLPPDNKGLNALVEKCGATSGTVPGPSPTVMGKPTNKPTLHDHDDHVHGEDIESGSAPRGSMHGIAMLMCLMLIVHAH